MRKFFLLTILGVLILFSWKLRTSQRSQRLEGWERADRPTDKIYVDLDSAPSADWIEVSPQGDGASREVRSTPPGRPAVEGTPELEPESGEEAATIAPLPEAVPPHIQTADQLVGEPRERRQAVINEIMFYPPGDDGFEDIRLEWIELHNLSDEDLSLAGHRFDRGIDFLFPETARLPAGGFVIVAANARAFRGAYGEPSAPLYGDWTGRLSNSREAVRLVDPAGETVDAVTYADQGDWARRVQAEDGRSRGYERSPFPRSRRTSRGSAGWRWESAADGGGHSLELINALLTNNIGTNWSSSQRRGGSPGQPNSTAAADVAPLIRDVAHAPAVPRPNEPVRVTATLVDEERSGFYAALHWRVSTRRPGPFQRLPMAPQGGGLFAAQLPGHPRGTIVEFYIESADAAHRRTWPAPSDRGQTANAHFQVDDEELRPGQSFYRLIMTVEDDEAFTHRWRESNAQINTTLIADDGSGPVIRYLCGTRVRGAGSRHHDPAPMRVTLPRDQPWHGQTRLNLNSKYSWLQFIGMKLFEASGLRAPDMVPVQVRRNGRDETNGNTYDFGAYVHAEPLSGDFVDAHFPDDNQGNLYKKVRPDTSWSWQNGNWRAYQSNGWIKQSRSADNDWSDLDTFLRVMNTASRSPNYIAEVEKVMLLDQWLRHLAVMALLANGEGSIANGTDDDYGIYRGVQDRRFHLLPHDLDTILGFGDGSRISNPHHTLLDFVEDGTRLNPLVPLFREPEIRRRYFTQMGNLLHTSFSQERFDLLVEQQLGGWVEPSTIRRVQDFMALRRHYAMQEVQRALRRVPESPPPPNTVRSLKMPVGKVVLHEILADNDSAYRHRGGFPDLIELFNPGTHPVSLEGCSLSDDPRQPAKYVFPAKASIAPGAFLLVFADDQSAEGEFHCGFSLKTEGESVYLFDRSDATGKREVLDSITFGPQITDLSIGRGGESHEVWTLTTPTPGAANELVSLGDPRSICINEWLAQPKVRFGNDFVELYNPSATPVSLGGASITDDPINDPKKHVFPPLSFIRAVGFLVLKPMGDAEGQRHPADLPFRLASHHEWLAVFGYNGELIDRVHFHSLRPDTAQGRLPDGNRSVHTLATPTPGKPNDTPSPEGTSQALIESLRVSELMYHAEKESLDFIEFTNIGETSLALEGVRLTNGIDFVFPASSLAPGGCALLVADRQAFEERYGKELPVVGEYGSKLSNGGEVIEIRLPAPHELAVQRFDYDDRWHPATDGEGQSLTVTDLRAPIDAWDTPAGWRPAEPTPGTAE